jgi:hypothetical protein
LLFVIKPFTVTVYLPVYNGIDHDMIRFVESNEINDVVCVPSDIKVAEYTILAALQ